MSGPNLTYFMNQARDWANRQDWTDQLVEDFLYMAQEKLNSELRVDRMIQFDQALIVDRWQRRCRTTGCRWSWSGSITPMCRMALCGFATRAGTSSSRLPIVGCNGFYNAFRGGRFSLAASPDTINGQTLKITYYGEVPDFIQDDSSWVYQKYGTLLLNATMMAAYLHAVGEEDKRRRARNSCART